MSEKIDRHRHAAIFGSPDGCANSVGQGRPCIADHSAGVGGRNDPTGHQRVGQASEQQTATWLIAASRCPIALEHFSAELKPESSGATNSRVQHRKFSIYFPVTRIPFGPFGF